MKKATLIAILSLLKLSSIYAQCEAATLFFGGELTLTNSGSIEPLGGLFVDEYRPLANVIPNDTYTIVGNNIFEPGPAYITVRKTIDNSVVSFGFSPLTFSTDVTEIEIHYFNDNTCDEDAFAESALSIQNESTLSISENHISSFKIFPNPSSDFLQIRGDKSIISYTIYNVLGTEVMKDEIKINQKIDIQNLQNGIYLIRFDNGITNKFIKSND